MDSNKDEAFRCVQLAGAALKSGDKQRALKFIKIAQRLDNNVPVGAILTALQNLDSCARVQSNGNGEEMASDRLHKEPASNGGRSYAEEHVKLIREINMSKDFYTIFGVEKSCSVEEIKRAYRKLSLKVHPDKNKAPGAEEAFKIVSKAFKCLSDKESRWHYDQVGHIGENEHGHSYNYMRMRRKRRTYSHDIFEENFDPDEIFTQDNVFRANSVHRTRRMPRQQREQNVHSGGLLTMILFQILLVLLCSLLVYLLFLEPQYALQKTQSYHIPIVMEKHGIEYFVKSPDFHQLFPEGSTEREKLEKYVLRDYSSFLSRNCHLEMRRRQWVRNYPTPHCDKLWSLHMA